MTLRSKLIRLAHANPELRGQLLPLLKEAAGGPKKRDVDEEAIAKWMPSALRREQREVALRDQYHNNLQTPGTEENQRHQTILDNQAKWEKLEGQWILRVPGQPVAALPTTGKQNAAQFVAFDLKTRKELALLSKREVFGWLTKMALLDT